MKKKKPRRWNSKFKGASYERQIAQRLSLWVSGPENEPKRVDIFWRSAMSGGRARIRSKDGWEAAAQCGDITATHSDGSLLVSLFIIECKHYRKLGIVPAIGGRTSTVVKFFKQLKKDGAKFNRTPLLLCKQNFMPELAITTEYGYQMLKRAGRFKPTCIFPSHDMYVFLLSDLLMLDYELFRAQRSKERISMPVGLL